MATIEYYTSGPKPLRSNYGAQVRTVRAADPAEQARKQETYGARCEREAERAERRRAKESARAAKRLYNARARAVNASDGRARAERSAAGRVNDMTALASE